jgi:TfoX/Sxy family transcriptional regulator of competence genes
MKWKKVSAELSELLESAVDEFNCQKRMMFGCPAYFVNNNMFTGVFQDYIFLRFSESDRQKIQSEYDEAEPFEPMKGRVMKEYMVLPESLYSDQEMFNDWLKRSFEYVSKLPPKEKKKKTRKK